MKPRSLSIILVMMIFASSLFAQTSEGNFQIPPRSSYPQVWWHWMDGNISKDGIRKDLDWMYRMGISGFHQFDAGSTSIPQIVDKKLPYMSDGWKDAFRYALGLADSLGFEVTVASCPGWSSTGGPWVTRENAMKKLVWRTVEVQGGKNITVQFPEPYKTIGKFQNIPVGGVSDIEPWYQDIAAVAVKLSVNDRNMKELGAEESSSSGSFSLDMLSDGDLSVSSLLPPDKKTGYSWIQYEFPQPQTFSSVSVSCEARRSRYGSSPADVKMWLQCSDDGVNYKNIAGVPESVIPYITVDFKPVTARYFRLEVQNPADPDSKGRSFQEFVLNTVPKINHAEEKGAFAAQADFMNFETPDSPDASAQTIILDGKISENGEMTCSLPEGRWRIYRFGESLTGKKNHPASPDATGLEVDKLDPEAWTDFFIKYLDMYKEASGGMIGQKGIQYLLTDSYEAEQMTWTKNMREEFQKRNGYDLLPWLPAVAGEVLVSSGKSERFLWDWRKTIGDLFAENYDRINGIVKEYGMKGRYTEAHENGRVFVGDGMDLKMTAAVPMSAIWTIESTSGSRIEISMADIKESASVAHFFGQNIVAAESLTANGLGQKAYIYSPENLKYTADVALSAGLNRFVIHESAHQPSDDKVPGTGLFNYGQWFNRHETWAGYARPWMDYLARSSYMLKQGRYVADILLYYGEDNCITGLYGSGFPDIPAGYSFDFINPKGLVGYVSFKDGELKSPSGMTYKVLALGKNCRRMSLPVLRKIAELAREGALIQGTVPEIPAGMNDDTDEFKSLVDEIWHSGLANVSTVSLDKMLKDHQTEPDFQCSEPGVSFVHRMTPEMDIYWVRNFSGKDIKAKFELRAKGPVEVWNPETGGKISFGSLGDVLNMNSDDARFLVVMKSQDAENKTASREQMNAYDPKIEYAGLHEVTLDGPWEVSFQAGRGAPGKVTFSQLASFTDFNEPGIKYFSGVASYSKTFKLEKAFFAGAEGFTLDLGEVKNLASVTLNGHSLGVLWRAPFRVNIPASYLKSGKNVLDVEVADLWPNRIIGDCQDGAAEHFTSTPYKFFDKNSPLLPSGLIGKVTLKATK